MADRRGSKNPLEYKLKWKHIKGVVDGDAKAFQHVLSHVKYDERGNNVLNGYLRKTANQLRKLPDSEYGDLLSEAHKQLWRCCCRFWERKQTGRKGHIAFRVYYYQRLRQCFTDRVRSTGKPSDLHNTRASSLDYLLEDVGIEFPNKHIPKDVTARIDIQERIASLSKRDKAIIKRIEHGWTVSQIKRDLIDGLMDSRSIKDYDRVSKMVKSSVDQSLAVIRSALADLWGVYDEDR